MTHNLTGETPQAIFECFFNSGLHGATWPNFTICLFQIGHLQTVVKNTGSHAEVNMIEYINNNTLLQNLPEGERKVRILLNYSPCSNCASLLANFARDNTVSLNIYFVRLYRTDGNSRDNIENKNGLRHLSNTYGVTLQTFSGQLWDWLASALEQSDSSFNEIRHRRMTDDGNMRSSLQMILTNQP